MATTLEVGTAGRFWVHVKADRDVRGMRRRGGRGKGVPYQEKGGQRGIGADVRDTETDDKSREADIQWKSTC